MKFDESVETSTGCTSQRSSSISPSMGKGNFFAFFSFPVDPVLDSAELQKRYHTLQRQFHPDQRHSTNFTAKEQSSNVENDFSSLSTEETDSISKYANEGYSILKDPFLRCRYLLKLLRAREAKLGGALSYQEEEALAVERENPVRDGCIEDLDEEFLMTMMAMNELIFAGDREQEMVRNQMIILKADLMERNEEQYGIVQQCWKNNDIKGLEACIHRWTYTWNAWNNLINRLP